MMHRKSSQAVHGIKRKSRRDASPSAKIYQFKPKDADCDQLSEIRRLEDENRRLREAVVRTRIELARLRQSFQGRTG